jgi:hypothetical protein
MGTPITASAKERMLVDETMKLPFSGVGVV